MGRNRANTGRIYIKLYMLVFKRKNFSFELPKNLVIYFKKTLVSLLLDTTNTSHSCLFLLNLKQRISPQLLKLRISESHLNPPKTICKHPKPCTAIQIHPPKSICNHPKPTIDTQSHPKSARIYVELGVTGLKPYISM